MCIDGDYRERALGRAILIGSRSLLVAVFGAAALGSSSVARDGIDRLRLCDAVCKLPAISFPLPPRLTSNLRLARLGMIETIDALEEADSQPIGASATDADPWTRLGAGFNRFGASSSARTCFATAIAILQRRVDRAPEDGQQHAELAIALEAAGRTDDADCEVERAVKCSQSAWEGWRAKGDIVVARALGKSLGHHVSNVDEAYRWIELTKGRGIDPAWIADALIRATQDYGAAVDEARRAKADARPMAIVLMARGCFCVRSALLGWRVSSMEPSVALAAGRADFKEAAETCRDDPDFAANLIRAFVSRPVDDSSAGSRMMAELQEPEQALVVRAMATLKELMAASDNEIAGRACAQFGRLQLELRSDLSGAEAAWREGIRRNSADETSWSYLLDLLRSKERWAEVDDVMTRWDAVRETERKLCLLAQLAQQQGKWDAAQDRWQRAVKAYPAGYLSNFGCAMSLLRDARDDKDFRAVSNRLAAAGTAYRRIVEYPTRLRELLVAQSALLAISGRVKEARASLDEATRVGGDDRVTADVRAALGE